MPPGDLKSGVAIVTVGLLEIQGAFLEHRVALQKAARLLSKPIDLHLVEVRTAEQLRPEMDALIIPGGESTTISIYLKRNSMEEPLRHWVQNPDHVTWGTCAGMILLSKLTENQKQGGQSSLAVMDIDVSRNYFGRQVQSFEADVRMSDSSLNKAFKKDTFQDTFPGVFIRAPAILKLLSDDVKVLATVSDPNTGAKVIVAAQQDNMISTAFHPELTEDCAWHVYFLEQIVNKKAT
ncbi:pyridoxal 5'-phosphate synthase subunit PdxT-like isoform X3 [Dreissena polymorpha]|uniref:glutaminase n=2 Tax=Dreissena polymorpha TaxID=45954 RepID=A0A9D4S8A9_DREPO|nr:pyridoxal 5'-phosphate synthase subunit PdxT-like isoform X2 [Dreissena polymorpha]XP_052257382.1 pyridoxal 5'-phosphate synthase subunit PdxT-like isoform X2 [Dreissena polymorpha]XP_052257406.1 pyridoxal 5'-phosphate synthase subunit PdxT-like isoform X3 [Dreissena polymorpha]XP_052257409.1 pyridoxal 5'-phosphate synthase subunit PdxT-like isoform X3 [Dreissena polymorpha]XP_052257417.1 pyridoxal 5'-phosphate synthase subunit PdxT-like isoform X3 [Dreissena polymorpha]KAH3894208.1 hypothe